MAKSLCSMRARDSHPRHGNTAAASKFHLESPLLLYARRLAVYVSFLRAPGYAHRLAIEDYVTSPARQKELRWFSHVGCHQSRYGPTSPTHPKIRVELRKFISNKTRIIRHYSFASEPPATG